MKYRYPTQLIIILILSTCSFSQNASSVEPEIFIEELTFTSNDFRAEEFAGLTALQEGLTLDPNSIEGTYTSPLIEAPIPFNAVVPQWIASGSATTGMEISLRTGKDANNLGAWQTIHQSADWTLAEDEDIVGDMLVVPAADHTHNIAQYMVSFSRDEKVDKPVLQELRLTFIDSTEGLSVAEMIQQQAIIDQDTSRSSEDSTLLEDANPKPSVISREVWCTDPRCDYTSGLEYQPVTHLILHHTVSSTGAGGDSAATVRAIWAFHAFTRGWGDIGYNYLVDTNGVLYEGHLGGDDVIGVHASGANAGTMALAAIGDYRTIKPPGPMIDSIINLFSWKADQKDINVYESSATLPNISWGLPHLMGHRDVYGTTECPGDQAHDLIPIIREEIASRIGLESPHIYVDELSSSFNKSNANWYVPIYQCGYNNHSWYTWSTTNAATSANWGEWRPEVPHDGRYRIEIFTPYCNTGKPETSGAVYTVTHAEGTSTKIIDQQARVGLWTSLGDYNLRAGNQNVIRLSDLTSTDDGKGVWFDAIRLLPLKVTPSATNLSPANDKWLTNREITFQWAITEPELVKNTRLEVARDAQFQYLIVEKEWPSAVSNAVIPFFQDYPDLYWRITVTSSVGERQSSQATRFGIDSLPPISKILTPYWLSWDGLYRLSWVGEDQQNGVASYTIEYRAKNDPAGIWIPWLTATQGQTGNFIPPLPGEIYEFRSMAVDNLGNREMDHASPDTDTGQSILLSHAVLLPVIQR